MVVVGHEGCWERLAEYFEYNIPFPAKRLAGGIQRTSVVPDPPIRDNLAAGGREGGFLTIAELLMADEESMMGWMRAVIAHLWSTGVVPLD